MQPKAVRLRWPMAGLNRRYAYQTQPPYSTPDAKNVRPDGTVAHRQRGGSRPGIDLAIREQLGSGNPIRLLTSLDLTEKSGYTFWRDDFDGTALGSFWTQATWLSGSPEVDGGFAKSETSDGAVGITRDAFSPVIDAAQTYEIGLFIAPYRMEHHGTYSIFARMGAGLDPTADGIVAALTLSGTTGTYSGSLKTYAGSVLKNTYAFTGGSDSYAAAGWFVVRIAGAVITCYWRGATLKSQDITADAVPAGTRLGFGLTASGNRARCRVKTFRVEYDKTGGNQYSRRRLLVASSNGLLYKQDTLGSLTQVSTSLTLASDRVLRSSQRLQKLYIADNSDAKTQGADGVRGTTNAKLDAASVSDWTTLGISTNDDVLVISSATGDIVNGTYKISSVASGEITLTTDIATGAAGTCSYSIERGPKVYDGLADTLALWTATASKGQVPTGCPIVALYRDRLFLAGAVGSPHVWYASRQGDPLDWDYAATDAARAVAGSSSEAGVLGEPITALIPHTDICMIIGCQSSIWIMRGDPTSGGTIDALTLKIGIVDKYAWCYTSEVGGEAGSAIVFLSHDGVYRIPPGCGAGPIQSISREVLPAELLNVNTQIYEVSLEYDVLFRGIHIYLTRKDSGQASHWWLDWETKSFWPASLAGTHDPFVVHDYQAFDVGDSAVLLGCRDGKIRKYGIYNNQDDGGNAISSYVLFGPFSGQGLEMRIDELTAALGTASGPVKWSLQVGDTEETAYNASAAKTGFWREQGLNFTDHPRVRGSAAFLKLANAENQPWQFEGIDMKMMLLGRRSR